MIKNFIVKKGDQLGFTITFTSSLPITSIVWGVNREYTDDVYIILKSLNNGISKIADNKYSFTLTSADTDKLEYLNYPYDIRVNAGGVIKTVLSGKLFIKETVFKVA